MYDAIALVIKVVKPTLMLFDETHALDRRIMFREYHRMIEASESSDFALRTSAPFESDPLTY